MISRRAIDAMDVASVVNTLKPLLASKDEAWRHRGQLVLAIDGYEDDPRELVDVPKVRVFLYMLNEAWPYWAYFFNQVDSTITLFLACICGQDYLGGGAVNMNPHKLRAVVARGFEAMNSLFEKHGFPSAELENISLGLIEVMMDQFGLDGL
jgi:hypothetical protein